MVAALHDGPEGGHRLLVGGVEHRRRARSRRERLPRHADAREAAVVEGEEGELAESGEVERHRRHIAEQMAGAERLTGSYPFDFARSVKAYRINRFLHDLIVPARRARFLAATELLPTDGIVKATADRITAGFEEA